MPTTSAYAVLDPAARRSADVSSATPKPRRFRPAAVAAEPVGAALRLLTRELDAGRAYLLAYDESAASRKRVRRPLDADPDTHHRAVCVGWHDGDYIYLKPRKTFALIDTAPRPRSSALPRNRLALAKGLQARGLLQDVESDRKVLTVRIKPRNEKREDVWKLRAATLEDLV